MIRILQLLTTSLLLTLIALPAWACDEYRNLSSSEMKEFRDKLLETGADPLDRLFAFEELSCSDKPAVRSYAIREGLKSATDPIVRHQILFEALMQKTRIDVVLSKSKKLKGGDKQFFETHSGVYSRNVTHRNREAGCIGLNFRECEPSDSLFIKGDVVEYNRGHIVGVFKLTDQNELVGYVRPQDNPNYSNIPAIIRLF